ncbi:MAG TPA: hypothetical protein VLE96_01455 [Chlamydiales bacterium]|nr:hypothetical protein [Chlamydiales bacterium]
MKLEFLFSYENRMFFDLAGLKKGATVEENRRVFQALNWQLEYIEVKHELAVFQESDSLLRWVESRVDCANMVKNIFDNWY